MAFVPHGTELVTFAGGLLVGGFAIHAAARYLAAPSDPVGNYADGVLTALFGALAWALVSWVPLLGPLLALVAWVGVIKWRYPVGWIRATVVAGGAWAVAVVVVALFGLFGLDVSALGVPGA
ncbi:MAG: hypothetical protein ABEI96_03375 [Haloarculaceae archaeon]